MKRKLLALLSEAGESAIDVAKFTGQSTSYAIDTSMAVDLAKADKAALMVPFAASVASAAGYPAVGSVVSAESASRVLLPGYKYIAEERDRRDRHRWLL